MNQCPYDLDTASAALDHGLPEVERKAFEAHLPCASCTPRLEALAAARHALGHLPSREEPSGAVRARVEAMQLKSTGARLQRTRGRLLAVGLGSIAAVTAALLALVLTGRGGQDSGSADLLVADHLRSVPEVRPAEVASGDPEVVSRFFEGHVSFRAIAPTLPNAQLLGGRLCRIEGKLTELLFYQHEQQVLSLFVAEEPLTVDGCTSSRDHQVCSSSHGDVVLTLVGKLPREEAERLLSHAKL